MTTEAKQKCWYCKDTGRFYPLDVKNHLRSVGWISCPHCPTNTPKPITQ